MKSDKNWSKTKTLQVVVPCRREVLERNVIMENQMVYEITRLYEIRRIDSGVLILYQTKSN